MTDPICRRVVMSQNDVDEFAETAMNLSLLASAMPVAKMMLLLRMARLESVVLVDTSRRFMLPS